MDLKREKYVPPKTRKHLSPAVRKIAEENKVFKKHWNNAGCTLAYMGFNLLPLSVIPNFRITNKGLVDVNTMKIIPLFEY